MSFGISNYSAATLNALNENEALLAQSIRSLASGLRINSAADDPAGLAISTRLTSQINGLNQAYRNTQTGINLVQTASGALNETTSILQRMQTLAVQAGNGTNSATDVAAMQSEMNQLTSQLTSISNSIGFNGRTLLAGGVRDLHLAAGADGGSPSLTISAMDAASLGVAASTATLTAGQNTANVQSLTHIGAGLSGSTNGAQYQLSATQMVGSAGNNIFTSAGVAGTSGTAAANAGNEALTLTIGGGTYTGATANYQVQVTSVGVNGIITGAQYSTSSSGTPVWTQATATAGVGGTLSFGLGATGISLTFANGAAAPTVGDQFTFAATTGATQAAVRATQAKGPNIGNETTSVSNTYTGTTDAQYAVRAAQIDSNNNVVGVQVSTDGGKTFGTTVAATGYTGVAFVAGTAANFNIGNGLTLTWNQSTFNANQVANSGDTFTFNAVASGHTTELLQLADATQVGGAAKFTGAAATIGTGVLVSGSQTSATLGAGAATVTANFGTVGSAGGLSAGTAAFTVTAAQAAVIGAGGTTVMDATAPAGLDISNPAAAGAALASISSALTAVQNQQSQLGGTQNALTHALNIDSATALNLTSANSNITDVDIAKELVNETRLKTTQQAALAMLAQANQMPSLLLKLLGP
ncbi:MAG: hypothetical protein H0X24_10520 [Ktedonobacterales bacterium]|nr:hypothetical protein [Ktedonobacterales bacterium]